MNESLEDWISNHPNVTKAPHRFGGTEYQVHGLEFMHSHGLSHLDIRLSKEDQGRVLKEKKLSIIVLRRRRDGSPSESVPRKMSRTRKN